jgi:hypothetical protein
MARTTDAAPREGVDLDKALTTADSLDAIGVAATVERRK